MAKAEFPTEGKHLENEKSLVELLLKIVDSDCPKLWLAGYKCMGSEWRTMMLYWKHFLKWVGLRDKRFEAFERWLNYERYEGEIGEFDALTRMIDKVGDEAAYQWFVESLRVFVSNEKNS